MALIRSERRETEEDGRVDRSSWTIGSLKGPRLLQSSTACCSGLRLSLSLTGQEHPDEGPDQIDRRPQRKPELFCFRHYAVGDLRPLFCTRNRSYFQTARFSDVHSTFTLPLAVDSTPDAAPAKIGEFSRPSILSASPFDKRAVKAFGHAIFPFCCSVFHYITETFLVSR